MYFIHSHRVCVKGHQNKPLPRRDRALRFEIPGSATDFTQEFFPCSNFSLLLIRFSHGTCVNFLKGAVVVHMQMENTWICPSRA